MCGIVGILSREPGDPRKLESLVRRMADAVRHRGPDEEGFFVTPEIALGIRRLSIIDVAGGQQPIFTGDRSKVIVFNGEIYNYRTLRRTLEQDGRHFATATDTEVALAAFDRWGDDGLRRLEGMFGLAVWDTRDRSLTLARDWMGQKSIYYAETDAGWAFASEIKALLALDQIRPRPDLRSLSHYMSMRYLPGHGTLFEGVHKMPAAHVGRITASERSFEPLWRPTYLPKWTGGEDALLDELDQRMREVVGEHLMSEVPLGAFLSGGIDSSLVVAYSAQASQEPVQTFSIGVTEESQSELPWARRVAQRYRTVHFERTIAPDLARATPPMIAALEEPVDPFAAGVYIVSQITSEHVTVALSGDGGDELFAGYDRYLGQQLAQFYGRLPAGLRRGLLRPLLRLVPENFGYKSLATRLRWLDRMAEYGGVERYAHSAAYLRFTHPLKSRIFAPAHWTRLQEHESETLLNEYFTDGCADAFVDKMLHADCSTRLADHQLPIVDRMSMAHSLEARNPFLDRRIAEFAMRIPAGMKMRSSRIKYVLRKLGERYLPRELLARKKQGFGFPLALWLRGELRPLMERVVEDSRLVEAGLFRRDGMRQLLEEHLHGGIDHNFRLWMLFNVELWYRHFIEGADVGTLGEWIDRGLRP